MSGFGRAAARVQTHFGVAARMFRLAPSVHACVDQGAIVFLDLKLDRYSSIDKSTAPAIVGVVEAGAGRATSSLLKRGLIIPADSQAGPSIAPVSALAGQLTPEAFRTARASGRDWSAFIYSCIAASLVVRARRLDRAFVNFARRKSALGSAPGSLDDAVARFELMRPWYPRRRVCLFDSLALMNYLLLCGHAPVLVMGVRANPFAAHCWLQADGVCLNDTAENCRSYTAITSV